MERSWSVEFLDDFENLPTNEKFTHKNWRLRLNPHRPTQTSLKSILSRANFTEIDIIESELYRNRFCRRRSLPKSILSMTIFTEIAFINGDLYRNRFYRRRSLPKSILSTTIFTEIDFIERELYRNRFYRRRTLPKI